jgi:hypothetical protein
MRKGPKVKRDKDGAGNYDFHVDWADNPAAVMEAVDRELKQHGLEVVTHDSDDDSYAFSIQPIKG